MQENDLSFIPITNKDILRWDREWAFYFHRHMNRQWFANLAYHTDATKEFKKSFQNKSADEIFHMQGLLDKMEIPFPGDELIDADLAEIGCGAGRLGRQMGHVAKSYLGVDYSRMAVSIARPLSPSNCSYFCLMDKEGIKKFKGSRDRVIARHFFIHNNLESASWVLRLANYLLKPGGEIIADFFIHVDPEKGDDFYRLASEDVDPQSPSRVVLFNDQEISKLSEVSGMTIVSGRTIEWQGSGGPEGRNFVKFQKPS